MEISTVMVRRLETGDECLINESDFDSELHEKLEAEDPELAEKPKRAKKGK